MYIFAKNVEHIIVLYQKRPLIFELKDNRKNGMLQELF